MSIANSVIESLFRTGDYRELLNLTGTEQPRIRELSSKAQVLVAHALAASGHFAAATNLVGQVTSQDQASEIQAHGQIVLGLIAESSGHYRSAVGHFQTAIEASQSAKDLEQRAWSSLRLFRCLIDAFPRESSHALLLDVRRAVTAAGQPETSAYLHTCVAALEGQHGRTDEALRHCEIADGLLMLSPHFWVKGTSILNRACIACLSWDFRAAARLLKEAKAISERCGHARNATVAENNLGHVYALLGNWKAAESHLHRVLNVPSRPIAVVAASDTLARIAMARRDLDGCKQALQRLETELEAHPDLATTYNGRWSAVTRVRQLLRESRWAEARSFIDELQLNVVANDMALAAALDVLASRVMLELGDKSAAAQRLVSASIRGASSLPELHPQFEQVAALLCKYDDQAHAQQLQRRARRIWAHNGIVLTKLEVGDSIPDSDEAVSAKPAAIVNSIASIFAVAHSPALLSAEVATLLEAFGLTAQVDRSQRHHPLRPTLTGDELTMGLGADQQNCSFGLKCQVPSGPVDALVLGDVVRLTNAALSLERLKAAERREAALWPSDRLETEAGALFLAEEMQALLTTVRRIAPTNVPVLITGETGTGKEVLARLIHAYSSRARATFLPFNCSAVPKDMLDSQLFGHRRGAFTGAAESFQGVIRGAANGTLFLDEIGETTLDVQPKLLRFLEASEVHPIGELHPARVDVRVIAATNAPLDDLVADGRFRQDLFYRLNIVRLHVPPLRERRVEIPALAHHYLAKHAAEYGKGDLRLSEETMEYLVLYRWPGNVRQLANEMRRLAALAESGAVLMPEHLSHEIASSRRTIPASERTLDPIEVVVRLDQPMAAAVHHVERALILYALKQTGGNMEETAALLGLSRKGLYLKRQRYGIEVPGDTAGAAVA